MNERRRECAAGPVTLLGHLRVAGGPTAATTGCTVNVPYDTVLEFVGTDMSFAGPLVVNGDIKSRLNFSAATISATGVAANLTGYESTLTLQGASLHATAGDVSIAVGDKGNVQIAYANALTSSVTATGAVSITGNHLMSVEMNNAVIDAGSFSIAGSGDETKILANASTVTTAGSASITSTGPKGTLNATYSTFTSGADLVIDLSGTESDVVSVSTGLTAAGAVVVHASETGFAGQIELAGGSAAITGASIDIAASSGAGGEKGIATVNVGTVDATGGDVNVRTGELGATLVKETLASASANITVSAGISGSCISDGATFTALATSICL